MANEGLGPTREICVEEFIEAVRAQLLADNPGKPEVAAKADHPAVQKNFAPFAEAVFRIATARARVRSSGEDDAAFWDWVAAIAAWADAMATWQQVLTAAFANWTPAGAAEQTLRAAVLAAPAPGDAPVAPAEIVGRIE
jgi:hypothetical protein